MDTESPITKQVTVDVPEARLAEFYAYYAHFLAGHRHRRGGPRSHRGSRCRERGERTERSDAPATPPAPAGPEA